jgi:putative flippase GtrA
MSSRNDLEPVKTDGVFVRLVRAYLSRQFVMFILFGGSAAVVNLASGIMLYGRTDNLLPYWAAVTVAAMTGLLVNFFLNYFFNFRYRGRSAVRQLGTFCAVAFVGIVLTAIVAVLFRDLIGIDRGVTATFTAMGVSPDFVAHLLSVGVVTFYSYAAHRYFTFNVGIRHRTRLLLSRFSFR